MECEGSLVFTIGQGDLVDNSVVMTLKLILWLVVVSKLVLLSKTTPKTVQQVLCSWYASLLERTSSQRSS